MGDVEITRRKLEQNLETNKTIDELNKQVAKQKDKVIQW